MNIGIIGAGAMGCLYACMLSKRHEVTLFDVIAENVNKINRCGIKYKSASGEEKTYAVTAKMSGEGSTEYDLLILFVKDTASRAALETNSNIIGKDTILLSLQNGMGNYEIMQNFAPAEHILLGTTKHNCVTVAPGEIYHSGSGITRTGSPNGNIKYAHIVAAAFSECGIDTAIEEKINHLLWEKLFVNMTINPITALFGCEIGVLAIDEYAKDTAKSLICEAVKVAKADGEDFDADEVYSNLIKTADALKTGKASMCQDIERGRKTEIDFINGAVIKLGKKYDIDTPCHKIMANLIHLKEDLIR